MKIVKQQNRNARIAKERIEHDEELENKRLKASHKHVKAIKVLEEKGLDGDLNNKTHSVLTPYEMEARKVYALTVTGKPFTVKYFRDGVDSYFKSVEAMNTVFITQRANPTNVANRRPYTLEGLCDHLGISKAMFKQYSCNDKFEELHVIAKMAEQKIVARLLDLGLMNETSASITKFYLKNISDLSESIKQTNAPSVGNITFISVGNREEYRQLQNDGTIPPVVTIDIEAELDGE